MSKEWTTADMPDLSGKKVIVTGANSGVGYEAARAFAEKGAHVIFACRSRQRAESAVAELRQQSPTVSVEIILLDLADLASVREFATTYMANHERLDILVNNAGIMAIPYRQTADGFEMQFGTNHLGHFALTGLLLDRILTTDGARVVTVSSGLHRGGKIDFDDLQGEASYNKHAAYSQSKLANLLFAYELQRKLAKSGQTAISVAAHPGYSATNLQHVGPNMEESAVQRTMMTLANTLFAQSSEMGALPTLYAATAPDVQGCDYIGPGGFMNMRGYPVKELSSEASYDEAAASHLWAISESLTGVRYEALESLLEMVGQ
jgi:NAD(P)-dependent dehydrogenase (short-subunit alcohol dehydrogenase family)